MAANPNPNPTLDIHAQREAFSLALCQALGQDPNKVYRIELDVTTFDVRARVHLVVDDAAATQILDLVRGVHWAVKPPDEWPMASHKE